MDLYVCFVKQRLHDRNKAEDSVTGEAEFMESYKLFYQNHFTTSEESNDDTASTYGYYDD